MERIEFKDTAGNWVGELERESPRSYWVFRYEGGERKFYGSASFAQRLARTFFFDCGIELQQSE